jgi:hypothetical protein
MLVDPKPGRLYPTSTARTKLIRFKPPCQPRCRTNSMSGKLKITIRKFKCPLIMKICTSLETSLTTLRSSIMTMRELSSKDRRSRDMSSLEIQDMKSFFRCTTKIILSINKLLKMNNFQISI